MSSDCKFIYLFQKKELYCANSIFTKPKFYLVDKNVYTQHFLKEASLNTRLAPREHSLIYIGLAILTIRSDDSHANYPPVFL